MKYQSEIVKQLAEEKGHYKSLPHYESECIEAWVEANKSAYPKLTDYQAEWLNYANEHPIGMFPYETLTDISKATIENVVPYAYKSAILKGNTGYRDIDTGEFLETFEEGRNLELVSVKMPVLSTAGKNLFDIKNIDKIYQSTNNTTNQYKIRLKPNTKYTMSSNVPRTATANIYFNGTITDVNGVYINAPKTAMSDNDGNLFFYIRVDDLTGIKLENFINNDYYIQLEEGSNATSYEPYKTNILTVNEDVTLREIGDVQDTLDCLTGEVTQRICEIVIDGNTPIKDHSTHTMNDTLYVITFTIPGLNGITGNYNFNTCITDKFNSYYGFLHLIQGDWGEGVAINDGNIRVVINSDKLPSLDTTGINSYFAEHPLTVCYKLAKESIKTVDLTVTNQDAQPCPLKPIEGTMHLETSSDTIHPSFSGEIPVEATTQNLASFIEE